jgi:hypothetical protein
MGALRFMLAPLAATFAVATTRGEEPLRISWVENLLVIEAPAGAAQLPGEKLTVNYLEAYCRAGSTDRDWRETVIGHTTRLVEADRKGHRLALECRLADGVIVRHAITAEPEAVDFRL